MILLTRDGATPDSRVQALPMPPAAILPGLGRPVSVLCTPPWGGLLTLAAAVRPEGEPVGAAVMGHSPSLLVEPSGAMYRGCP